ncbi:MAG: hypothetical protein H0X34_11415 [Chthoniobacterales bacterium]|nr:hypothetical protein [Chthoniobacterales bacterium]
MKTPFYLRLPGYLGLVQLAFSSTFDELCPERHLETQSAKWRLEQSQQLDAKNRACWTVGYCSAIGDKGGVCCIRVIAEEQRWTRPSAVYLGTGPLAVGSKVAAKGITINSGALFSFIGIRSRLIPTGPSSR